MKLNGTEQNCTNSVSWTAPNYTELKSNELLCIAWTQMTYIHWTASPLTHSVLLLSSLSFLDCSHESWTYPISDSFCQIFLWFITLSAPQLDVIFKHGCFLLQTNLISTVRNERYILRACLIQPDHIFGCDPLLEQPCFWIKILLHLPPFCLS